MIFAHSFSERSAMAVRLQLPRKKAPNPTDWQPGNGGSECGRAALSSAFREPPWTVLISLFAGNLLVETGWRPDCISQPGSPVSTTQHVKAAYEQSTVGPTQVHSSGALLQDNELVPQYPYFGSQPPPRPEAVVQQPDEKQANCDHQPQSCSDSVAAATPADGVFGSDTRKQVCDSPLHGLAWLAAQEQHDQPGGVTRDRRKPAMGGRHASCDIGPRHHNHVSLTLPDFGRSRAKSGGVLQGQECQYLHPLFIQMLRVDTGMKR
jgi:hypothetical protein